MIDDEWQLAPFDAEQAMVGLQGSLILANGGARPISEVRAGGLHRYRFINASSARYFRMSMAEGTFWLVGTDGGLLDRSTISSLCPASAQTCR